MEFRAYASSSAGNLYSAHADGPALLLDCGLRLADIRQALGFKVAGLDGCCLTHHHGDHARAAPDLMRAGVDVYASAGTWAGLGIESHHRAILVAPRRAVRVGRWAVLPFDVPHDAEGALGYLIEAPDGDRLLFATDLAYLPYRFNRVTHVAIECNYAEDLLRVSEAPPEHQARVLKTHMSLERVLTMLAANDLSALREVWLLHLSDRHADAAEFKRAVQAATGKPVYAAPRRLGGKPL